MRPMMSPRPGSAVGSGTTELAKTRRHAAASPHSARSHSAARSPVSGATGVVVGRCRRRRHRGDGGHRRLPQRAPAPAPRGTPRTCSRAWRPGFHSGCLQSRSLGGRTHGPGALDGRAVVRGLPRLPLREAQTGGRWSRGSERPACEAFPAALWCGAPATRCGAPARGRAGRAAASGGTDGSGDQCLCGCTCCAWSCAAAARDCRGRRAFSATPTVHGACLPAERGLLRHPVALGWDDVEEGRRRALCWRACRGV